jgi:transposase
MAELAKGLLRKKIPELQLALEGKLEQHHRFLLELQLQRLEAAEKDLAVLEQRIRQMLEPYAAQLALLDEIPGVDWTLAAVEPRRFPYRRDLRLPGKVVLDRWQENRSSLRPLDELADISQHIPGSSERADLEERV